MPPSDHSRIGASGAERWLNCPGSVRMQHGLPDSSSEVADEGTAAHELAEKVLVSGAEFVSEFQGMKIKVGDREFVVDDEMVEGVQLYVDTVRADHKALTPGVMRYVEKSFHLKHLHDELYGTNDASLAQTFGLLQVYDLKYGKGVLVEVEDNPQLKMYALGALKGGTCEEVEIVIVQPRAPHSDGPVRRWRISVDDLLAWGDKVLGPGAHIATGADAPLAWGKWCKWCKAKVNCSEVKAHASALARVAFDSPIAASFPVPAMMTGAEIAKALAFTRMFSSWGDDVAAYAKAQLERGVKIEGFKLVMGKKNRAWEDEQVAEASLTPRTGHTFYKPATFKTVAQVEAVLKDSGMSPKETAQELEGLVKVTQKPTMAEASDKRQEVLPAIQAFDDGLFNDKPESEV